MGGRWRLLALAAATFALVSGCGGNSDDGGDQVVSLSSSANSPQGDAQAGDGKTDEDKVREFAKCMREHGVDMPDPQTNGQGGFTFEANGNGMNQDQMKAADEACRPLLPNGGKPKQLDPEALDKLRAHAKCLREHGVDVPDPDPNSPGISISADPSNKDKIDAAMEACKSLMPDGGKLSSSGGGGGPGGDKGLSGNTEPPK